MDLLDHGWVHHRELFEQLRVLRRRIVSNSLASKKLARLREERITRVLLSIFLLLERKGLLSREELKAEYERILALDRDRQETMTLDGLLLYAGVMRPEEYAEELRKTGVPRRRQRSPQRK